jgi:SAM-dependent methyltransferase
MLEHTLSKLYKIEDEISPSETRFSLIKKLRLIGLNDYGELITSLPHQKFPKLSNLLPKMASPNVQESWTGSSGTTLLKQTLDFTRSLAFNFTAITEKSLFDKKILDFGCGYGRISRMMYFFTDEKNFYGVDPWRESIDICYQDGLNTNFHISEYLPNQLPVNENKFDLIFAFSVFTHLSEKATKASLNSIVNYIKDNGLIAITIRPIEYWDIDRAAKNSGRTDILKARHNSDGFSFLPHNRTSIEGDITYGDTSMTFKWITDNFPRLEIAGTDRSLSDPYQIYIFLRKSKSWT